MIELLIAPGADMAQKLDCPDRAEGRADEAVEILPASALWDRPPSLDRKRAFLVASTGMTTPLEASSIEI
jgi:hypothetical protein